MKLCSNLRVFWRCRMTRMCQRMGPTAATAVGGGTGSIWSGLIKTLAASATRPVPLTLALATIAIWSRQAHQRQPGPRWGGSLAVLQVRL